MFISLEHVCFELIVTKPVYTALLHVFFTFQICTHISSNLNCLVCAICACATLVSWSLLLYPGGGREVMRRADDPPYKLYWGSRLGFAKLAIATGAVVVPVASVGASETFPVAADVSLEWLWGRNKDLTVVTAAEVAADAVSAAASARVSDSVTNGGAETAVAVTAGAAATALGDGEGGASDQDILSPPHNPRTMRSSTAAATLHSAANANAGVIGSTSSGTLAAGTENAATAQGAVSSSLSSSKVPAAGSKIVSGVRNKHTDGSTPVSVPIAIPWPQHWQRWYFKIGEVRRKTTQISSFDCDFCIISHKHVTNLFYLLNCCACLTLCCQIYPYCFLSSLSRSTPQHGLVKRRANVPAPSCATSRTPR